MGRGKVLMCTSETCSWCYSSFAPPLQAQAAMMARLLKGIGDHLTEQAHFAPAASNNSGCGGLGHPKKGGRSQQVQPQLDLLITVSMTSFWGGCEGRSKGR